MAMSYIVGVYGWYSGFRVCEIRQCIRYSMEVEAGSDTLQLDALVVLVCLPHLFTGDSCDALAVDLVGLEGLPKYQRGENQYFCQCIVAFNVGGWVGFRVPLSLGLSQDLAVVTTAGHGAENI